MQNIKFGFAEGEDYIDMNAGQGNTYASVANNDFQFGDMLGNDSSFGDFLNGRMNEQMIEVSDLCNALTCRHRREVN